ncbi:hypothetical protein FQR65_LT01030 [Abscondita terminalis]|nr:hypothetical protein FQR65_LT01030 [Abscondita terminalis]
MKKKYNITAIENPNHIFVSNNKSKNYRSPNKPADFEEAITAAKYGKFNVLVLLTMIPTCLSTAFSTTTMSYIFPVAQCDLDLSLDNKGMLNSITYLGMIASGFIFGYLTDATGRRRLIMYIFVLDGLVVILSGLSQRFIPLLILKFLGGFIVNGGYAAYISYANEFHAAKYRPLIALYNAIVMSGAASLMAGLAWLIFTDKINIPIFDSYIVIRSWNVFLFVCSIPSFMASIIYFMMPESPKYLMSMGKNKEALQVFRKVYSVNTGLSPDTYPVRVLVEEKPEEKNTVGDAPEKESCAEPFKSGWHEITRLFKPPYVAQAILVLIIHFGYLLGLNTLRLWIPQLFIAIYDYDAIDEKPQEFDLCTRLDNLAHSNVASNATCSVNYDNKSVYLYVIICSMAIVGFLLISLAVVAKVSKKKVLVIGGCLSGVTCVAIYFSQNFLTVMILYTVHTGLVYITTNVVIAVVVNVFPTSFRAMAISLTMVSGRVGASVGNIIFPIMLVSGCIYPFGAIGAVIIFVSLLTLLLPDTEMTPLP